MQSLPHMQRAILETLVYSDIFDHPLRLDELHRYLSMRAAVDEVDECAKQMDQVNSTDGYFFLGGRGEIVGVRKRREAVSLPAFARSLRYGRILGWLPFVRMIGLTGSLAMLNVSRNLDMDYMLVAAHGRVWMARLFALVIARLARVFGDTICPNLIVSERALEWRLHDLYSARELCQMIPITGMDVYSRLMKANHWVKKFLPNVVNAPGGSLTRQHDGRRPSWSNLVELPLRGKLGDRLERWEMNRKIERFSKQPGFGEETVFTAEICQGNFHHHRKWTREMFEEKIQKIVIARRAKPDEAIPTTISEIASSPIGSSQ